MNKSNSKWFIQFNSSEKTMKSHWNSIISIVWWEFVVCKWRLWIFGIEFNLNWIVKMNKFNSKWFIQFNSSDLLDLMPETIEKTLKWTSY